MHGFPIQQAKVLPPPLRPATVRRDRLLSWLDERASRRLLLITAEAGYGKTTLLADWARRAPVRVAWCRVEREDANFASLLRYLVAAGREIDPDFAPLTSVLLDELAGGANNREIVRATFLQELGQLVVGRRVAFVLDDAHLLRRVREVAGLLSELVNRGPERLTWIFAGRQRPGISVTRLRAIGEMHELRRADLQFQLDETIEMFRAALDRPIPEDLIETVVRRTEGWAASLQLVEAAIRDRSDADTRTFIRSLNGARGDLYDYLAEEVVGELEPEVQSFLMRTSVMRVVTVEDIELVTGMTAAESEAVLAEIVPIGLLDAAGPDEPDAYRYHPLVREFLESRLRQEQGHEAVVALHRRLAVSHEGRDWRTAAYHYEAIKATDDLQRVLVESAPTIMARGEFDVASQFANGLGQVETDPALNMFTSRVALDRGDVAGALRHAQIAYDSTASAPPGLRGLALANLLSMQFAVGNAAEALRLSNVLLRSDAPARLISIARASKVAMEACDSGRLDEYQAVLEELEDEQRTSNSTHYLGVTLLNLAVVAMGRGRPTVALARALEAVRILEPGSRHVEVNAAHMCVAWAYAHLGRWADATAEMQGVLAQTHGPLRNEPLIESAEIWIRYGELDEAVRLASLARRHPDETALARTHLPLAEVELLVRQGRTRDAKAALDRIRESAPTAMGFEARRRYLYARIAVAEKDEDRAEVVGDALRFADDQRIEFFGELMLLVQGIEGSSEQFDHAVCDVIGRDPAYASILAEDLAPRIDDLETSTWALVTNEVVSRPERWRPALRAAMNGSSPSLRAAELLDQVGTREDVAVLRRFARTTRSRSGNRRLGQQLARRVAPQVFVEDMGRVRIEMAGQYLEGLEARRKVLELVCFLLTRPGLSATRDEVLDAVWPDTDPNSAVNSLNQTLYFLRRVFEPNYVEDLSPNYVHHESDVVWLDPSLVSSRSLRCRTLLGRLAADSRTPDIGAIALEYRAKFALDFSYEDWATAYRDTLHASYLQAMETAISGSLLEGRDASAITTARRVLEIDPRAEQVELMLIRAYHGIGAPAAAREQYAHYASLLRNELGVEPPTLAEVLSDPSLDMNT